MNWLQVFFIGCQQRGVRIAAATVAMAVPLFGQNVHALVLYTTEGLMSELGSCTVQDE